MTEEFLINKNIDFEFVNQYSDYIIIILLKAYY